MSREDAERALSLARDAARSLVANLRARLQEEKGVTAALQAPEATGAWRACDRSAASLL